MQFINNFRGIAILLVILVHSISAAEKGDSIGLNLLSQFLDNCTVLFVVVAGYLFSYQIQGFNYKRFLTSKISSVIIPYIVISLPAILLYIFDLKPNHYWIDMEWFREQNPVYQYFYMMFTGASLGPLWFIPMIIVLYLFSPIIIFAKEKNLLFVGFVLSLIPAVYLGRPEFNESVLQASIYFLPAYLLGIILSAHGQIYKTFNNYSGLVLLGFIVGYFIITFNIEMPTTVDLLFKLVLAVIVLSCCYKYLSSKHKLLDMFARLSFFLFFIHGYFTGIIRILSRKFPEVITAFSGIEFMHVIIVFCIIVISSLASFITIKLLFGERSNKWVGI